MRKIVAISGTHGTGKSTIAYSLCTKLKMKGLNTLVLDELARKCPFPINKEAGVITPRWLICKQMVEEIELQRQCDYVIADRSVFDAYCYDLAIHGNDSSVASYANVIGDHITTFYKAIYVPNIHTHNFQIADGVRDMDKEFRQQVNDTILGVYKEFNIKHTIINNIEEIYKDLGV